MPPSGSQSNISTAQFYHGFELIELEDPAIPSSCTLSTNNNNSIAQVPNNSFATGQGPPVQLNAEISAGRFGGLFNCLPIPFPFWQGTTSQITSIQQPRDTDDNYEISLECIEVNFKEDFIGGGNQSSVFKGKWNGRLIALKKLNRASEIDIEKLIELSHPNVVKTIGLCSKDIYPCIVMEFCEKGALFDLLRGSHVGKHQFLRWARNIASGMQYIHSKQIIHRDLKSPNVLVDKNDTLKICDFGSLYTWDKSYMRSTVMSCAGTSQWMSPEIDEKYQLAPNDSFWELKLITVSNANFMIVNMISEMLKQELCSEKVDVWSYSVILWELVIQEIPYKNISSMAIMYGVGSDKLKLHMPKTLPDNLLLLMKVCFAKKPRNRPSFASILNHLDNLEVEIESVNEDAWRMRKEVWKKEVNEEAEKFRQNSMNGNDAKQLDQQQTEKLVKKRMNELRHAEELREMYQSKIDRVNNLMEILQTCLNDVQQREEQLVEHEKSMRRAGTAPFTPPSSVNKIASGSVPELKSVKVQKPTMMRANQKGQKTRTDLYTRAGQHAIVTYQISDDDLDNNNPKIESDEELYESDAEESERLPNRSSDPNMCHISPDRLPNIPNNTLSPPQERLIDGGVGSNSRRRISHSSSISTSSDDERFAPRSRHSYGFNSHQNSFEECGGAKIKFSSRATSARSSMNFAQRQSEADVRANRNSISHLPYEHTNEQRPQFVCPCCAYEFRRNSTARISGISADSGVASTMDERQMSALTLETDECICGSQKYGTDLYRNQQARWSDGKIHRYHHRTNNPSANHTPSRVVQPPHRSNRRTTANSSFTRNSPARRVASASNPKRHRSTLNRNSTGCLDSALTSEASMRHKSSNGDVRRSPSSSTHSSNSQPRLFKKVEDDESPDQVDAEMVESGSGLFMNYRKHEAIQEMDSSMSSKSNRSPKKSALMEHSSSTMASSLERSLELGIADGLTDKEDKLRAVKTSFRTHRRCASNPTNVIAGISRIVETSTESDNDPVYC